MSKNEVGSLGVSFGALDVSLLHPAHKNAVLERSTLAKNLLILINMSSPDFRQSLVIAND